MPQGQLGLRFYGINYHAVLHRSDHILHEWLVEQLMVGEGIDCNQRALLISIMYVSILERSILIQLRSFTFH